MLEGSKSHALALLMSRILFIHKKAGFVEFYSLNLQRSVVKGGSGAQFCIAKE